MDKKRDLTRYELQSQQRIKQLIQEFCEGSQQRFVEKTGVNKGSVSQYLSGKNTPSNITAKRIADAFNIAPAWVMGFDVTRNTIGNANVEEMTDESILLSNFRELTGEGKQKALEYVNDLNQNMRYSTKLQEQQNRFLDEKEIVDYNSAIEYLTQANAMAIPAFSAGKLSEEDIIAMANTIKLAHRDKIEQRGSRYESK